MSESVKAVAAVLGGVEAVTAAVAWADDRPDAWTWAWRTAPAAFAAVAFGWLARETFRKDLAPDLLAERSPGGYYNRGGFALTLGITDEPGGAGRPTAHLVAYFQNMTDARCEARVGVRGGKTFALKRDRLDPVEFRIDCPPAAYGEARAAIAVPPELAGRTRRVELGATVHWPDGRGAPVRYTYGRPLWRSADFTDRPGCLILLIGLLDGRLFYRRPATVRLAFPAGARDDVPPGTEPLMKILWDGWNPAGRDRP